MPKLKITKKNEEKGGTNLASAPLSEGGQGEGLVKNPPCLDWHEPRRTDPPYKGGNYGSKFTSTKAGGHPFIVKICDALITLSFALIFLGVPLFFTGLTLQGMAYEKQIFFYFVTLIGLFAWILKAILQGKIIIKKTPLDIPIIIFLVVMLINGFFSVNQWNSFLGGYNMPVKSFFGVLLIAMFYWLLVSNINKKRVKIISFSLILSIGIVVVFAILNFFSINLIGSIMGIFGLSSPAWANAITEQAGFNTIGMISNLEMFICASILILLGVLGGGDKFQIPPVSTGASQGGLTPLKKGGTMEVESVSAPLYEGGQPASLKLQRGEGDISASSRIMQWLKNSIIYILLAGCLFSIFVLGNYISLVSLIIGLGILLILCMSGLVNVQKKIFTITSVLFAIILVYIFIGKPPINLRQLPTEIGLARGASWTISKETFKDKYFLGTGMGNFGYAFNKYRPETFNQNALWNTRFSEATGLFYEAVGTIGIIGIVAFILLLLAYVGVVVYSVLGNTNGEIPPPIRRAGLSPLTKGGTRGIDSSSAFTKGGTRGIGSVSAPLSEARPNDGSVGRGGQSALARASRDRGDFSKGSNNFLYIALFSASVALGIDIMMYLTSGTLIVFCAIIASLGMAVIALDKKEYFKDFELSYNVKPEYALALSFTFICLSCAMILIFINLGKVYIADIYAKDAMTSEIEEVAVYKIQKAIKLNPYQGMYYQKLGDLMARLGDQEMNNENRDLNKAQNFLTNALSLHKKAIELMPSSAFSWENLGVLAEFIVRYDPTMLNEAEAAYKQAIDLDPLNPALRMRMGVINEAKADLVNGEDQLEAKKKFYDNAKTNFLKAIELKRDLAVAYDALGRLEEKLGNLDEAIQYISVSYQLNADNVVYPFNLGRLYYNRGVSAETTNQPADTAGERELEDESARMGEDELISSLQGEGDVEEGEDGEEEEQEEEEHTPELEQSASAETAKKENDFKMAGLLFQKALELDPNYADALYSLAMVYEQLGYNQDAKIYYQKTMDALPEDQTEVRDALRGKIEGM
ncbi:tetratricopeptide repeat protein [Patescibacteria group bacterium]